MRRSLLVLLVMAIAGIGAAGQKNDDSSWTSDFTIEKAELVSTGRNPYFVLEPGYELVFESGNERLVITVLTETKMVDGVETRVVQERETRNGQVIEVSRNYFAISRRNNSVFYFGEDVDMYKNGKVTSHEGSWLSGTNGARFGLAMPGQVLLKGKYYEEVAPKVAMDRAEIVSVTENVKTPAGEFPRVLKVAETTPLELMAKEHKYYVAGIGLVQDGSMKLVKYGQTGNDHGRP